MQNYIFTNILFPVQCIFRTYSLWKEKLDFHLELVLMSLFSEQKERISHLGSLVIHQFHSISFMHKNFSFSSLFPKYQDSNLKSSIVSENFSLYFNFVILRSFPLPHLLDIKIPPGSFSITLYIKIIPGALSSKSLFKDLTCPSSPFAKYQDSPLALFSITFK